MTKHIIYELPLNERIRTILRLEFLFKQTSYHLRGVAEWDSRSTISGLLEIMNVISRIDLRSETSKELQRQKKAIEALASIPGVDTEVLQTTIANLNNCLYDLNTAPNVSETEAPNEFLKAILQRESIPGGTCDFDVPMYHHWLCRPEKERITTLEQWLNNLNHYWLSIDLILNNLRQSAVFNTIKAEKGFYQQALDSKSPFQLIRVKTAKEAAYFAELSGGKHRFSVRLMLTEFDKKPTPFLEDVNFSLACCVL